MNFTRGAMENAADSNRIGQTGQDFLFGLLGVIHMDGVGCVRMGVAVGNGIEAGAECWSKGFRRSGNRADGVRLPDRLKP